ncbi:MAG: hypothetical protein GXP27_19480 [Planctomycetes bacterium]|nr:hypothetical protein [Planctomycetota bacterium]
MPLLPDRERRHLLQFYLMPRLGYRTRIALAGGLIVAGVLIQLFWPGDQGGAMLVVSLPLLFAGNLFLLARGYDLRPSTSHRNAAWERTTRDRFAKILELEERVRSWDETIVDITCTTGVVSLLVLGVVVAALAALLADETGPSSFWAQAFLADAAVLILPHWVTGIRRGWRPTSLRQQIEALERALAVVERFAEPPCQIQPMLEMVGQGDRRTPLNARVFIRFPDGPEDFLGLQFQVAINNVQGTNYPYLYAVLVARKTFGLHGEPLKRIRAMARAMRKKTSGWQRLFGIGEAAGLTISRSSEEDVDVIVIRQRTTKTSGYHTDAAAVARIAAFAWRAATTAQELAAEKQSA